MESFPTHMYIQFWSTVANLTSFVTTMEAELGPMLPSGVARYTSQQHHCNIIIGSTLFAIIFLKEGFQEASFKDWTINGALVSHTSVQALMNM